MGSARARTAMTRRELSRPVRLALEHEVICRGTKLLDYGCGRGADVLNLNLLGLKAVGWDPTHRPETRLRKTEAVNLGYVVNVIEDPIERAEVLRRAWGYATRVLVISARLNFERDEAHSRPYADGWKTAHQTFQRFFDQLELGRWIDRTLGESSVAAGPGVFYVFRDASERQMFISSRFRHRTPVPNTRKSDRLFIEHRSVLKPLISFVAERGRLPKAEELEDVSPILEVFGSIKSAFRVVVRVTDEGAWRKIQERRSAELLVYLALSRFGGPDRFGSFPLPIQLDIRAFQGSYKAASSKADRLLFAAGQPDTILLAMKSSLAGKATPSALYVHRDALGEIPALLRVYEGCARVLVGTVEEANIIKLGRDAGRVSYLSYPTFDHDPHPSLHSSLMVDIQGLTLKYRDYSRSSNPPILHRKEQFLATGDSRSAAFRELTIDEETHGLYERTDLIGTRSGWEAELARLNLQIADNQVKARSARAAQE